MNQDLKILMSFTEFQTAFSANDTIENLHFFVDRISELLLNDDLDGLDIKWEYDWISPEEKLVGFAESAHILSNFVQLLMSLLRIKLLEAKPIISLTVSEDFNTLLHGYNFENMTEYIDFVNLPAFGVSQLQNQQIHLPHPNRIASEMDKVDTLVDLLISLGIPKQKLIIGIPLFGTAYVDNPEEPLPDLVTDSTREKQRRHWYLTYPQICSIVSSTNFSSNQSEESSSYGSNGFQRIGYNDQISIKTKAKYVLLRNLGGISLWTVNDDDYKGICGYGSFPLLRSAQAILGFTKTPFNAFTDSDVVLQTGESKLLRVLQSSDFHNVDLRLKYSCTRNGYFRDPADCARFYRCTRHKPSDSFVVFLYECPRGLVFDEEDELCNWPSWSAPCEGSNEVVPVTPSTFSCPSTGYHRDKGHCKWFYYCSDLGNGILRAFEFRCPSQRLAFDERKMLCNWIWLVPGCDGMSSKITQQHRKPNFTVQSIPERLIQLPKNDAGYLHFRTGKLQSDNEYEDVRVAPKEGRDSPTDAKNTFFRYTGIMKELVLPNDATVNVSLLVLNSQNEVPIIVNKSSNSSNNSLDYHLMQILHITPKHFNTRTDTEYLTNAEHYDPKYFSADQDYEDNKDTFYTDGVSDRSKFKMSQRQERTGTGSRGGTNSSNDNFRTQEDSSQDHRHGNQKFTERNTNQNGRYIALQGRKIQVDNTTMRIRDKQNSSDKGNIPTLVLDGNNNGDKELEDEKQLYSTNKVHFGKLITSVEWQMPNLQTSLQLNNRHFDYQLETPKLDQTRELGSSRSDLQLQGNKTLVVIQDEKEVILPVPQIIKEQKLSHKANFQHQGLRLDGIDKTPKNIHNPGIQQQDLKISTIPEGYRGEARVKCQKMQTKRKSNTFIEETSVLRSPETTDDEQEFGCVSEISLTIRVPDRQVVPEKYIVKSNKEKPTEKQSSNSRVSYQPIPKEVDDVFFDDNENFDQLKQLTANEQMMHFPQEDNGEFILLFGAKEDTNSTKTKATYIETPNKDGNMAYKSRPALLDRSSIPRDPQPTIKKNDFFKNSGEEQKVTLNYDISSQHKSSLSRYVSDSLEQHLNTQRLNKRFDVENDFFIQLVNANIPFSERNQTTAQSVERNQTVDLEQFQANIMPQDVKTATKMSEETQTAITSYSIQTIRNGNLTKQSEKRTNLSKTDAVINTTRIAMSLSESMSSFKERQTPRTTKSVVVEGVLLDVELARRHEVPPGVLYVVEKRRWDQSKRNASNRNMPTSNSINITLQRNVPEGQKVIIQDVTSLNQENFYSSTPTNISDEGIVSTSTAKSFPNESDGITTETSLLEREFSVNEIMRNNTQQKNFMSSTINETAGTDSNTESHYENVSLDRKVDLKNNRFSEPGSIQGQMDPEGTHLQFPANFQYQSEEMKKADVSNEEHDIHHMDGKGVNRFPTIRQRPGYNRTRVSIRSGFPTIRKQLEKQLRNRKVESETPIREVTFDMKTPTLSRGDQFFKQERNMRSSVATTRGNSLPENIPRFGERLTPVTKETTYYKKESSIPMIPNQNTDFSGVDLNHTERRQRPRFTPKAVVQYEARTVNLEHSRLHNTNRRQQNEQYLNTLHNKIANTYPHTLPAVQRASINESKQSPTNENVNYFNNDKFPDNFERNLGLGHGTSANNPVDTTERYDAQNRGIHLKQTPNGYIFPITPKLNNNAVRRLHDSFATQNKDSMPWTVLPDEYKEVSSGTTNSEKNTNGILNGEADTREENQKRNIPFIRDNAHISLPHVACTREGLFYYPDDCNMFYECYWDRWLEKFTIHIFACPVKLVFDDRIYGCSRPEWDAPCTNSLRT